MATDKQKYKGNVAAQAWQATKGENDPDFDAIPNGEFKENLQFRADKVRETGIAITNFEKEVASILAKGPEDDSPMAVVEPAPGIDFEQAAEGQVKHGHPSAADEETTDAQAEKQAKADAAKKEADKKEAASTKGTKAKPSGKASAKKGSKANAVASAIKEESTAPIHP